MCLPRSVKYKFAPLVAIGCRDNFQRVVDLYRRSYKPPMPKDSRRHAPATIRNREPILDVLRRVLPAKGHVLEVASGTGEHVSFFAAQLPPLHWLPSDIDPAALASIEAYRHSTRLANIDSPVRLDATSSAWPVARVDAVLCINMIHIAPWDCCVGLLRHAGRLLPTGAPLVLYGPFARNGRHTSASNARFDQALRLQNPAWGVRDLHDVSREAVAHKLGLDAAIEMPANNLTVVFRKC